MPERLVDVEKQGAKILHTFPVTIKTPAEEEAFKQKTAYEMRESDWSSDVCSSDLRAWPSSRRRLRSSCPDIPVCGLP